MASLHRIARAALAAAGLLLTPPLAAQEPTSRPAAAPQEPQQPRPVFRTGVRVVRVDVTVTGRGDVPVADLRPEDFLVEEDGVPQTVDTAQFVRLDGERSPGNEDSLEIRSQEHAEAEAARDDIRVFVVFFDDYHVDKLPGITVPMRRALKAFVESLGPTDLVGIMDPLTPLSAVRFTRDRQRLLEQVNKFEGRQGEVFPVRSALEEAQYQSRNVRMVRAEVTLSALNAIVSRLGSMREGRRSSVVFVSQGPPTYFGRDGDVEDLMREILRNGARGNVAIHALDPRGLGDNGRGGVRDTLFRLSEGTGGRPVINTNGLEMGLECALRDASAYYVLGYTPSRETDDGKFHKITVKVKRPGTRVLSRSGYWAPSAEAIEMAAAEAARPAVPGLGDALSTMATSKGGRAVDAWVAVEPGPAGQTRVRVTWERATTPGRDATVPERVLVELLESEQGPALGEPRRIAASVGVAGPEAQAVMDVPAGDWVLRFTAEGAGGVVADRWTQALVVPVEPPVIGTPAFRRARSAVELRQLLATPDGAPAASRQFRRTDRVFVTAALGTSTPSSAVEASAELLNRAGQRLVALVPVVEDGAVKLELPVASLVASRYVLRLRLAAGGREAEQLAAFDVVP